MHIEFRCPQCDKLLRVTSLSAGKKARCPSCGSIADVPAQSPGEAPTIAAIAAAPPAAASNPAPAAAPHPTLAAPPPPAKPVAPPLPAKPAPPGGANSNPFAQQPAGKWSENPYASPVQPLGQPSYVSPHHNLPLASRGTRLVGSILDSLVFMVAGAPFFAGIVMAEAAEGGNDTAEIGMAICMLLGIAGWLALVIVNCVMISTRGQSIAKRMLGMRIIRYSTGELPGFVNGVLLRIFVPALIQQACGFFSLIDALWIFGEESRCLHDLIADTKVIDTRYEPAT